jgi:glycolate oxidase iron-sulfur subunit
MRTGVVGQLQGTAAAARAEAVIGACVHCGLCNAACPTYRLTGDELDGPRGRIYLMKAALEGEPVGSVSLHHLDRCLECRACESACPSGVEYHRLYDVGHGFVAEAAKRAPAEKRTRRAIAFAAAHPKLLAALFSLGRKVGFALPKTLKEKIPPETQRGAWPATRHGRRMLILGGCVQSAAAPGFNAATARVFDAIGVSLTQDEGCCGAVPFHLQAEDESRDWIRRRVDAWAAALEAGCEAILVNASGCAAFVRDWPDLMADDGAYQDKARRVVAAMKDPIEVLRDAPLAEAREPADPRIAVHDPCTLRNGPGLAGEVAALLARLGYEPQPVANPGQCCGSAGAYSLLQPEIASRLRETRLDDLVASHPAAIVTANIGCWMHLAAASPVPVRHWIEAVDDLISAPGAPEA